MTRIFWIQTWKTFLGGIQIDLIISKSLLLIYMETIISTELLASYGGGGSGGGGGGGRTRQMPIQKFANNDRRGVGKVVGRGLDKKTAITVAVDGSTKKSISGERGGVQWRRWWKKCWLRLICRWV